MGDGKRSCTRYCIGSGQRNRRRRAIRERQDASSDLTSRLPGNAARIRAGIEGAESGDRHQGPRASGNTTAARRRRLRQRQGGGKKSQKDDSHYRSLQKRVILTVPVTAETTKV